MVKFSEISTETVNIKNPKTNLKYGLSKKIFLSMVTFCIPLNICREGRSNGKNFGNAILQYDSIIMMLAFFVFKFH